MSTKKRSPTHFLQAVDNLNFTNSTSTNSTLEAARARLAQDEDNARNVKGFKDQLLSKYYTNPSHKAALKACPVAIVLYPINSTAAEAATLVAEADAASSNNAPNKDLTIQGFSTKSVELDDKEPSKNSLVHSTWSITHVGRIPFSVDNDNYMAFYKMIHCGAVGNGKTDNTADIIKAMAGGNSCGEKYGSSSVKRTVTCFPACSCSFNDKYCRISDKSLGTYLISTPMISYYQTQMVGDLGTLRSISCSELTVFEANRFPILSAAPSFVGLDM